jgi:hypothetical protein
MACSASAQRLLILPCREILEGADADMGGRDAGEDGAGHPPLAQDDLTGGDGGQRAGGGDAKGRHRLRHDVFAQDGAEPRAPVAHAGIGRAPRALQLDVEARAIGGHDLAQQDRAPVAQLRHPAAELVPGIDLRQRLRPSGIAFPAKIAAVSGSSGQRQPSRSASAWFTAIRPGASTGTVGGTCAEL